MDASFSVRTNHLKSLTSNWRRAAAQLEYRPTLFSTFVLREKLLLLKSAVQSTTTPSTSWWPSLSLRYPTSSSERHCSGGGGAANSYSQGDLPSTPLSATTSPSCICTSWANSRCFFLRFLRALRQTDGTFFPGPNRRRKRSTCSRKKTGDQIKRHLSGMPALTWRTVMQDSTLQFRSLACSTIPFPNTINNLLVILEKQVSDPSVWWIPPFQRDIFLISDTKKEGRTAFTYWTCG